MKRLISLLLAVVLAIAVPMAIMGEGYGDLFAYPEGEYSIQPPDTTTPPAIELGDDEESVDYEYDYPTEKEKIKTIEITPMPFSGTLSASITGENNTVPLGFGSRIELDIRNSSLVAQNLNIVERFDATNGQESAIVIRLDHGLRLGNNVPGQVANATATGNWQFDLANLPAALQGRVTGVRWILDEEIVQNLSGNRYQPLSGTLIYTFGSSVDGVNINIPILSEWAFATTEAPGRSHMDALTVISFDDIGLTGATLNSLSREDVLTAINNATPVNEIALEDYFLRGSTGVLFFNIDNSNGNSLGGGHMYEMGDDWLTRVWLRSEAFSGILLVESIEFTLRVHRDLGITGVRPATDSVITDGSASHPAPSGFVPMLSFQPPIPDPNNANYELLAVTLIQPRFSVNNIPATIEFYGTIRSGADVVPSVLHNTLTTVPGGTTLTPLAGGIVQNTNARMSSGSRFIQISAGFVNRLTLSTHINNNSLEHVPSDAALMRLGLFGIQNEFNRDVTNQAVRMLFDSPNMGVQAISIPTGQDGIYNLHVWTTTGRVITDFNGALPQNVLVNNLIPIFRLNFSHLLAPGEYIVELYYELAGIVPAGAHRNANQIDWHLGYYGRILDFDTLRIPTTMIVGAFDPAVTDLRADNRIVENPTGTANDSLTRVRDTIWEYTWIHSVRDPVTAYEVNVNAFIGANGTLMAGGDFQSGAVQFIAHHQTVATTGTTRGHYVYLRTVNGLIDIDRNSIFVTWGTNTYSESNGNLTIEELTAADGSIVYRLHLYDVIVGSFTENMTIYPGVRVNFAVRALPSAPITTVPLSDIIRIIPMDENIRASGGQSTVNFTDHRVGADTVLAAPPPNMVLSIIPNSILLTWLEGQLLTAANNLVGTGGMSYNWANGSGMLNIAPGGHVQYRFHYANNAPGTSSFTAIIPIPTAGGSASVGTTGLDQQNLQRTPFGFTLNLMEEVVAPAGFSVSYSTGYVSSVDAGGFVPWSAVAANPENIRMVRIERNNIPYGSSGYVALNLTVPTDSDGNVDTDFSFEVNRHAALLHENVGGNSGFALSLPVGVRMFGIAVVEFNSRGGSAVTSQDVAYDGFANEPTDPTLTNYTFGGWFTSEAIAAGTGGTPFDFADTAITDSITLYARWTRNTNTVTFQAGTHGTFGGTGAEQTTRTTSVPHGATIEDTATASVPSATSTNANYEFAGWRHAGLAATDENLDTDDIEEMTITAAITFIAQWRLVGRTVTFEAGTHGTFGGTGAEQTTRTTTVPHGTTIATTATANVPTATPTNDFDYRFSGWRHTGLTSTDYNLTTPQVEAMLITAAITFTAQYELIVHSLTFDATAQGILPVNGERLLSVDVAGADPVSSVLSTVPVAYRTGHTFLGWSLIENPGMGKLYASFATGTEDNAILNLSLFEDVILYAVFEPITATPHAVTFLPGAATGVTNMPANRNVPNGDTIVSVGVVADPQRAGFTFAGWTQTTPAGATGITSANVGAINVTQAMTFTAQWTPSNGGTPAANLVSTKSANVPNNSHVIVGQTITYTIRVQNTGDAASGGVTIQDIIPAGMTLVADSATYAPNISGNTLTWSIPSIAAGQTVEVSFQVTVNPLPNGIYERTFRNTATVNGNNTNTVNLITRTLVKVPDRTSVNVGETINWTLSGFHNPTQNTVANFTIVDIPGLGLNFRQGSIPAFTNGAGVTYDIRYRVAGSNEWHTHAAGISANAPHNFSLPQPGDIHYTEIGLFFGTVPAGFGLGNDIVFTFVVSNDAPNNELTNRFRMGFDNIEQEGGSPYRPTVNPPGTPGSGTGMGATQPTPTIPFNPTHHAYMIGDNYGNVRPNASITRAEVATIFFRLITDDYRTQIWTQTNPFPDVQMDNWFNNAVSTMANAGVIVGMPDGTFQPQRAITRAEFAVAMTRFFEGLPTDGANMFPDIADHWAAAEINAAARLGWVTGMPNGNFEPNRPITRAEAAALINRILGRLPRTVNDLLPGMATWADNANVNAWYYLHIQEATNSNEFVMQADGIHKTWTQLLNPRDWQVLERPHSRPQDIIGQYRTLNKVQPAAILRIHQRFVI